MKHVTLAATVLAFSLAACTPSSTDDVVTANMATANEIAPPVDAPAPISSAMPLPTPVATASPDAVAGPRVLTLAGLGPLKIGQPVPAGSGWAARGAQASEACTTVSSPDYTGVYAIVIEGKVARISAGKRADVKLIEGIGVGATEAAVMAAFPGFRATSHKYVDAPAKYLTAPNAESGDPALRFEIGSDCTVTIIHVGTAPALDYVEGCS